MSFVCTTVYFVSCNISTIRVLEKLFPSVVFLCGVPDPTPTQYSVLWLVEGPATWCASLLPQFDATTRVLMSLTSGDMAPPTGWTLFRFSSAGAGSILHGSWAFVSRCVTMSHPRPLPYTRSLRHAINPATRCPGERVPYTESVPHGHDSGVHLANLLDYFCCPSVFAPSCLIRRRLTSEEIARIFDIPTAVAIAFLSTPPQQLPWLTSAPLKLLMAVARGLDSGGCLVPSRKAQESIRAKGSQRLTPKLVDTRTSAQGPRTSSPPDRDQFALISADGSLERCSSSGRNPRREPVLPTIPETGKKEDQGEETRAGRSVTPQSFGPRVGPLMSTPDPIFDHRADLCQVDREIWDQQYNKSVKADDAATPVHLWDGRIWQLSHCSRRVTAHRAKFHRCPLDAFRVLMLKRWVRNVRQGLARYLTEKHGNRWWELSIQEDLTRDLQAGADCVWRATEADWWEWRAGSRLFFWRWPPPHREAARDGYKPFIVGDLPSYRCPQPREKDKELRGKVREKLSAVLDKRYISKGNVLSLTSYFGVPKGDKDIRMVYDASRSQLNHCLWAPGFALPTVDTLVKGVDPDTWMGDLDIGEMFLNFCLHPDLQPYVGVDLRPYLGDVNRPEKTHWERWVRCLMGLTSSPYVCIKGLLLALELVKGDPSCQDNPFHWDQVVLNLPGMPSYDPRQPMLARMSGDRLAALIITYVDDMRAAASGKDRCWQVMHRVASQLSFLGIQVASRKTRPPSRTPGPWAGAMVLGDERGTGVKATQEKWEKTRRLLEQTLAWIDSGDPICRKVLESVRGSLVYLQRTYPAITPYVKGYHLTIDGWRDNRDREGWRLPNVRPSVTNATPPSHVHPVPRFRQDVLALLHLFSDPSPPPRYVRPATVQVACYGYADASGTGFGSTMGTDTTILYTHGIWGEDVGQRSSNYRELVNLVNVMERGVADGSLLDTETWIFTDNSTSESVFWKGHSSSPLLSELALRLRKLEMGGRVKIHMVHIPGTRMIAQGTDGLSRGDYTEGVMCGESMLNHVPLHLSALARQPTLEQWVESWVPNSSFMVLTPEQWFWEGHGLARSAKTRGTAQWVPTEHSHPWLVWSPPPSIADVALDELEMSRHKRCQLSHIFIIPRLMTYLWRKRLGKICDAIFEIPPGARPFWPSSEHEPLLVGLTLRFSRNRPWQARTHPGFLELVRQLCTMWTGPEGSERHILRQLCNTPRRMDGVP